MRGLATALAFTLGMVTATCAAALAWAADVPWPITLAAVVLYGGGWWAFIEELRDPS